jgi:hypothetical protein
VRTVSYWLSLILIFMIPWEGAVTVAGIGALARVTGLVVGVFWLATVVVVGKLRRSHPFYLVVYLFVLWNTVSVFWSASGERTVQRIETYWQPWRRI